MQAIISWLLTGCLKPNWLNPGPIRQKVHLEVLQSELGRILIGSTTSARLEIWPRSTPTQHPSTSTTQISLPSSSADATRLHVSCLCGVNFLRLCEHFNSVRSAVNMPLPRNFYRSSCLSLLLTSFDSLAFPLSCHKQSCRAYP